MCCLRFLIGLRGNGAHALDLILKLSDTVHVREFLQHDAAREAGNLCGESEVLSWKVLGCTFDSLDRDAYSSHFICPQQSWGMMEAAFLTDATS
jgi:hypothetical protein